MKKFCKKCGKEKNLDCFHNDKRRGDGRYPNCKDCHYAYTRERYKNPDVKEKRIKYYNKIKKTKKHKVFSKLRADKFYFSEKGRAMTLYNNAKKSAKKNKLAFNLNLQKIIDVIHHGQCEVTKIDFDLDKNFRKKYKKNPFSPSIDRISPSLGYTDENTRIVIWWYNMAKGEMSDKTLRELCLKVVNA